MKDFLKGCGFGAALLAAVFVLVSGIFWFAQFQAQTVIGVCALAFILYCGWVTWMANR